ncbi:hypothetical protein [Emticicia sp. C21]|uniref:hypothetical protein n=1 Tax=Emticicia sp. C21 TaxID=2302915 RepID=UPI000E3434DD|nr:hypothetical protein [Emticicia sp. C21]
MDWKELAFSPITKKIESLDISEQEKQKLNTVLCSMYWWGAFYYIFSLLLCSKAGVNGCFFCFISY